MSDDPTDMHVLYLKVRCLCFSGGPRCAPAAHAICSWFGHAVPVAAEAVYYA